MGDVCDVQLPVQITKVYAPVGTVDGKKGKVVSKCWSITAGKSQIRNSEVGSSQVKNIVLVLRSVVEVLGLL